MTIEFSSGRVAIAWSIGGGSVKRYASVRWDDRTGTDPNGWWLKVERFEDEPEVRILLTADDTVDCYEAGGFAVAELARNHS